MINKLILFSSITITNGLIFLSSSIKEPINIYNENSVININDYIQGAFEYAQDINVIQVEKLIKLKMYNFLT